MSEHQKEDIREDLPIANCAPVVEVHKIVLNLTENDVRADASVESYPSATSASPFHMDGRIGLTDRVKLC